MLSAVSLATLTHAPFDAFGRSFGFGSAFGAPAFFGSAADLPSLAVWFFSHFHFPSLRWRLVGLVDWNV